MSATHVHLILNHLPAVGLLFAGVLFIVARLYRSAPFQRVSLWLLVASAVAAIPVYLTGEPAEEAVEELPGVAEAMIERHEEAATVAFVAMETLGAAALLAALVFRRAAAVPKAVAAGVVAVVVATSGLLTWTGYLGGQIRHTEIRSAAAVGREAGEAERNEGREGAAGGEAGEARERDDD